MTSPLSAPKVRRPSAPRKPLLWRIAKGLLALAGLALGVLAVEFGFRVLAPHLGFGPKELANVREFILAGTNIEYEGRAHILYSRIRAREEVNSDGFVGPEWSIARTDGVGRIVCMGASTTEGGNDDGTAGSYPFLLEGELERRSGRDFEVFNAGMSGWTTAEMTVAWFLDLKDLRPDLVVIHEAVNDSEPRMYPNFRNDYSHYRKTWEMPCASPLTRWFVARSQLAAWLFLGTDSHFIATLVNQQDVSGEAGFDGERFTNHSEGAFRRNVLSIGRDARADGATVVLATLPFDPHVQEENIPGIRGWIVGTLEHNEILRELSREHGFVLVDLEREFRTQQPELVGGSVFLDLVHVTTPGNACKARLIAEVLEREWLPGLPTAVGGSVSND